MLLFWPSLQQMLATYRANRRMPPAKKNWFARFLPQQYFWTKKFQSHFRRLVAWSCLQVATISTRKDQLNVLSRWWLLNIVIFSALTWGDDPKLTKTNIFQMGWNMLKPPGSNIHKSCLLDAIWSLEGYTFFLPPNVLGYIWCCMTCRIFF